MPYWNFHKNGSMNNYFSDNSFEIIEMFRIKDYVIYHKDFCLIQRLFKGKLNLRPFQGKRQFSRTFQDCTNRGELLQSSTLFSQNVSLINLGNMFLSLTLLIKGSSLRISLETVGIFV